MTVLVFGANGRLGKALVERLGREHDVVPITRHEANVTYDAEVVKAILDAKPEVVINATAYNGIEQCKANPHIAWRTNASAPLTMAVVCAQIKALFIHYSTDYVFSGDEFDLWEDTPLKPWGVYGATKRAGEEALSMCAADYCVFRLSSLYGQDYAGMLQPIKQVLEGRGGDSNPVQVLHQLCCPTSAKLVADATAHVVDGYLTLTHHPWSYSGIYHLATTEPVWKTVFTKHLLWQVFGHRQGAGQWPTGEWNVIEGTLPEPRPIRSVLNSTKFPETFGYKLPTWTEDLASVLPLLAKVERPATV